MSFQKKLEAMALSFFLEEGKGPNKALNQNNIEKLMIRASEAALALLAVKTFPLGEEVKKKNEGNTF